MKEILVPEGNNMAAGKMCYSTRVDLVLRKCVLNTSFSQWKYPCLQRTVYRCLMWHRSPSVSGITDNSPETNNTNARQKGHSSIKPIFTGPESSESKLLKVAIVGEANSGKSTLTNRLIGEKICAVTAIPHTTRRQTIGVFIVENCQIVLMDTPGMVTLAEGRRLKMTREHMLAPRAALEEADLIAVINDAADKRRSMRIHESILEYLKRHQHTPSILILNKVDNVNKKTILLSMANILLQDRKKDQWGYEDSGGWSKFEHVFMVSARTDDGITDLKQYFAARSKPGDWLYPAETFTDQSVTERINEIFREKLLELYPHEIPWQIRQVGVLCEQRGDHWKIHHKLYCRRKSQRRCVMEEINRLHGLVLADLENILGQPVDMTVDVGVSEKVGFQTPLHTF